MPESSDTMGTQTAGESGFDEWLAKEHPELVRMKQEGAIFAQETVEYLEDCWHARDADVARWELAGKATEASLKAQIAALRKEIATLRSTPKAAGEPEWAAELEQCYHERSWVQIGALVDRIIQQRASVHSGVGDGREESLENQVQQLTEENLKLLRTRNALYDAITSVQDWPDDTRVGAALNAIDDDILPAIEIMVDAISAASPAPPSAVPQVEELPALDDEAIASARKKTIWCESCATFRATLEQRERQILQLLARLRHMKGESLENQKGTAENE